MTAEKTTHRFEAEVDQVLRLVINSLYSNREIFLRELLSNASDALDKLRFASVTDASLIGEDEELRIRIEPDEEKRTLTIADNGIGMSRDEMVNNLGTIAQSGSREFLAKLEEAKQGDLNIIGQFGVGFYSAYLVADRVRVVSKAAGSDQAYEWVSEAKGEFSVEPSEREGRGTSVILELGEEHVGFLKEFRIRSLVERYSDYLNWPIELGKKKDDELTFERVNRASALWQRSPKEVEDEQYADFYKHITGDWDEPLAHRHFKLEGTQQFAGLLFLPKRAPFDLFMPQAKHGLRLYVRRVLIMDSAEQLLPNWLRFLKGVLDSEDLPLNISRETLQDSRQLGFLRKHVVKQSLEMLAALAKDQPEDYETFWKTFGLVVKEALHISAEHKDRVAPLLRYETDQREQLISLEQYKEKMPEGQKAIYYALGQSRAHLMDSPHIEALTKRGYEVLFMTDPVDQFAVAGLSEWEGLPLVSAQNADLKLDEEESEEDKKEREEQEAELEPLRERFAFRLEDEISEVRTSNRLTDSAACLVIPEGGLQPHIERLLRVTQGEAMQKQKRILEINPEHPIIQNLKGLLETDRTDERIDTFIDLLYDQALIVEGSPVEKPGRFAKSITTLLTESSARAAES